MAFSFFLSFVSLCFVWKWNNLQFISLSLPECFSPSLSYLIDNQLIKRNVFFYSLFCFFVSESPDGIEICLLFVCFIFCFCSSCDVCLILPIGVWHFLHFSSEEGAGVRRPVCVRLFCPSNNIHFPHLCNDSRYHITIKDPSLSIPILHTK